MAEMRNVLEEELVRRSQTNPRYSLRAFARSLGIEPAALSKILRGKRRITPKMRERLLARVQLPREKLESLEGDSSAFNPIRIDEFKTLADWQHFAILELTRVHGFIGDLHWVARALNLSLTVCTDAVERLERMGYLKRNGTIWEDCSGNLTTTTSPMTNVALKTYQKQLLEQAIQALENTPIELRDQSALCLPVDPALMPKVKQEIRKFRRKLVEMIQEHGQEKEVYHLSISMFPASEVMRKKQ